jgi:anaerobic selenocysteine-containing dehydrogenase
MDMAAGVSVEKAAQVTGVSVSAIKELGELYSASRPAAILAGWGLQRHRRGAYTYRLLDALAALAGNIGVSGGGVSHGMDENRWFDGSVTLTDRRRFFREIPKPQTGRGLLEAVEPSIELGIVSGGNPVVQCPDSQKVREAFGRLGFLTVIDSFMTDTAAEADLVLPTTHFLQEEDVVGSYWHNMVQPVKPVVGRLGEEKTDLEIFAALAARVGLGESFPADPAGFLKQLVSPLAEEGTGLERIAEGPVKPASAVNVPFEKGAFPTPSGRFQFVDAVQITENLTDADYPYHLITPHPHSRNHSQLPGEFRPRPVEVLLSPTTARKMGVDEGDALCVESRRGRLKGVTCISGSPRDDTVVVFEGTWESLGGSANRLTSDRLTDMGLSATYFDTACRLRRAGSGETA